MKKNKSTLVTQIGEYHAIICLVVRDMRYVTDETLILGVTSREMSLLLFQFGLFCAELEMLLDTMQIQ